jgi:hypothetical protein
MRRLSGSMGLSFVSLHRSNDSLTGALPIWCRNVADEIVIVD